MIEQVGKHKLIEVCTGAELLDVAGFVGNFSSVVKLTDAGKSQEVTIDHGVIILATGGQEYQPQTVLGRPVPKSEQIITQRQLESRLSSKNKKDITSSVVMVQCAGSRGDDLAYCSKVCCNHAVKNALTLKGRRPEAQVIVLYRDMRTYGLAEEKYREAREKGVVFIPYTVDRFPSIRQQGKAVEIVFFDPILGEEVSISPELLVLSVGIVPQSTEILSKMLKVPVTADKFFLEAHVKLRPVEMPVDGVYVCGLAHSPKPLDETVVQAQAAAAKAAMPMINGKVKVAPIVSNVNKDECIGCGLCVSLCPFKAIQMVATDDKKKRAETIVASCKACGICAAHCPTFAISMGGFTNEQIVSQIEAFGQTNEVSL